MICVLNDPLIFEQYIFHTKTGQAIRVLLYFPFFTKVGTTAFLVEWKTVLAALLFLLQHCFMHNAIALLCFDSLLGYCFTMQYVFARKTIPFPFVCPLIALNLKYALTDAETVSFSISYTITQTFSCDRYYTL